MNRSKTLLIGLAIAALISLVLYWLFDSWMVGVAALVGIGIGVLTGLKGKNNIK